MSQTVDSKVVEMQFDNAQFERNVATSLSTLDKLKGALNFGDSVRSLGTLENAAGKVSMNGLIGAIDTVSSKFSALEVIGITALANITTQAINAGERLVSSLSIDNITAGWAKFGEKTQSVATLTAQGYELETVNEQLEKLNWFTDETSYNFTDMTSNIAKFTATGQDLESSVTAMQGIANWAALSGQNAMTASRAMYQLSQAMGAGVMRKEDYKSIQNASMDTKEFREHAIQAAVALGTLKDNGDGTYRSLVEGAKAEDFAIGQFADHLTKDMWFTSDVMMQVFKEYSSAVEPVYEFTEEYNLLASQVLEAKHKFDEGGDSFKDYIDTLDLSDAGKKDLEELVKDLDDFGVKALEAAQQARTWEDVVDSVKDAVSTAWMKTFELIFGTQEQATQLFTAMANELYDVFAEPINGLNELLEAALGTESAAFSAIEDETKDLTGRGLLIEGFANIWNNLLDTLSIIPEAFRQVFPEMTAEQLYHAIENFRDFTEGLKLSDEAADKLSRTLYGIFSAFDIGKTVVGTIAGVVFPELIAGFSGLADHIFGTTAELGEWVGGLNESIKTSETLKNVAEMLGEGVRKVFEVINWALDNVLPIAKDFVGFIGKNFVTPGFEAFGKLLETLRGNMERVSGTVRSFRDKVADVLISIRSKLDSIGLFDAIKNIFSLLTSVGKSVFEGLGKAISAIVGALAHADFKGIIALFTSLTGAGVGIGLMGVLKQLKEFIQVLKEGKGETKKGGISALFDSIQDTLGALQEKLQPDKLRAIAISIAILAGSLFVLSRIDGDKLKTSLGAMAGLFGELMAAMFAYTKIIGDKELANASGAMLGMAASVFILASALKKIADIDPDRLLDSVIALGVVMAELTLFSKLLAMGQDSLVKGSIGMIAMAVAVRILAGACEVLAGIDQDGMVRGVVAVGALLGELSAFSLLSSDAKHMVATGAGMLLMAAAIRVLAKAVISFGNLSWEQIGKGLLVMGAALAEIAIAVNMIPTRILAIGPALLVISGALLIISGVLRIMGGMQWEQIGKSMTVLGGTMLILAVGVNAMEGALKGAAAMVIVAGALMMLTPVLLILGQMKLENIGKALAALAGVFIIFGVAAVMLEPLTDTLLKLARAMALMGLSVTLVGVGLLAAGLGLVSMAAGITALAAAWSSVGPIIIAGVTQFLSAIIGLIPTLATALARGVVEFVKVLADAAPELLESIIKIVLTLVEGLTVCIPKIAEMLLVLILSVFDLLATYAPQIAEKAVQFIGGVLVAIGKALSNIDLTSLTQAILGLGMITAFLGGLGLISSLLPGAMVGVLELGILIGELTAVLAALGLIKQIPGVEWLVSEGSEFAAMLGHAIGNIIGSIIGGIAEGATSTLPAIGQSLAGFMNNASPFFDGVKSMGRGTFDAVGELANAIITITKAEVMQGIAGWITGSSSINTFTESLTDLATGLSEYASIIDGATFNEEKLEASENLAKMLASFASHDIPKTGGLIGLIMGNSNLAQFGNQLLPLAQGLRNYAGLINISEFNEEKISASENLAKMLASLASHDVPKSGGLVGLIMGNYNFSTFGSQLKPLAEGLRDYVRLINTSEFNDEKITASENLARVLMTLAGQNIPKSGGLLSIFEGESSLSSFSKQLPVLAKGLTSYCDNLGNSLYKTVAIDSSLLLIRAISTISSVKVPTFTETDMNVFTVQLPSLASGLSTYAENLTESILNQEKINASINLANLLATLVSVNIPATGGVVQWLLGNPDLTVFGEQLPALAKGLTAYTEAIGETDFSSETVNASIILANMLGELAKNNIPATGGVFGFLRGNEITTFSNQLPNLAKMLTAYANNLGESLTGNSDRISKSKTMIAMLSDLSKAQFDQSGGLLGKIFGGDDLTAFGNQLPNLAKALTSYADNLGDSLTSDKVERADTVAKMLTTLQGAVSGQNNGGLFSSGELEKFGKNITAFGAYIVGYCNDIRTTKPDEIQTITKKLVEAINGIGEADLDAIGGLVEKMKAGATDIAGAAYELTKAFSDGISDVDKTDFADSAETIVSKFSSSITEHSDLIEAAGVDIGKRLGPGFEAGVSDLETISGAAVEAAVRNVNSQSKDFTSSGNTLGEKLVSGMKKQNGKIKTAFSSGLKDAKSEIRSKRSDFYSAGEYLVKGFASGISENTWRAEAKARAMAKAAADAAKKALKERSPSKVFYEIGDFAGKGFVNALNAYEPISYKAGSDMAISAKEGLSRAISSVSDIIADGIDTEPTIRPVLDLNDIRVGTSSLNKYFNRYGTFDINSNLNVLGARMNNRMRSSSNADMISAINSLEKSLTRIPRNTYVIDGITYDDGSNISTAIDMLVRAAKVGGRA